MRSTYLRSSPVLSLDSQSTVSEGEAGKRNLKSLEDTGNSMGIDSGKSQMLQAESVQNLFTDLQVAFCHDLFIN